MAVLQMQRIDIYAFQNDRKALLEALQRKGVIEITKAKKDDKVFKRKDVSKYKAKFDKNISSVKDAIAILNNYAPENKGLLASLNGRTEVDVEKYDDFKLKYHETVKLANRLQALSKLIAEKNADRIKLLTQIEMLTPWMNLDLPLNFSGTKTTKAFIGSLSGEWSLEAIYGKLADHMPLDVSIISSSKEQTCIFVLCPKENGDKVYETLRKEEFTLPSISYELAPAEQLNHLKNLLSEADDAIRKAQDEIRSYEDKREDLKFLEDYEVMRSEKYDVIGGLRQSKNVVIITGYIIEKETEGLITYLENHFDVFVEISNPSKKADVPVALVNNGFSRPLEGVLEGYSLPGKGELDPTMVMSLFYYVLFGLMLSDAGYGLLIAGGCAFALLKFKTMEESMKNTLKMYLYCGISTVFWGIMFGSYFGDIFDIVAQTFMGRSATDPVIPPLWFFPVKEPMRMLAFAMLFGLIHILTGLIMKAVGLMRQKDIKGILYDCLSWFVLVVSGTILLLSMDMIKGILGVDLPISSTVATVMSTLSIISAIVIVLTNGRESKNPFKRFLKGLYALYGITSYLSDVLSYSRLLALGLATGVIGSVINKMAAMPASGALGPVFFTIIVIAGHLLNLAINALGAYVHTNRLQYVEFFGKFYDGGGRKFAPFSNKTKYYKIKEKN